jgi:hypothetical protein
MQNILLVAVFGEFFTSFLNSVQKSLLKPKKNSNNNWGPGNRII